MSAAELFNISGQVALVTGASSGLGLRFAEVLAENGAAVVLVARRKDRLLTLKSRIEQAGGRALAVETDVLDRAAMIHAFEQAEKAFGCVTILVNNAGVAPENPAENVREEDYDLTVGVNLKGTFFASQAAGRIMIRQNGGRIINVSSQAGYAALPGESIYCMTKAGINHLTKCLAVEWGKYNITVNGVAPTFIETPGTEACLSDPAFRADVTERIAALHRIGQPSDVTGAVVFLASSAASLITGHTIVIDGGWTAR